MSLFSWDAPSKSDLAGGLASSIIGLIGTDLDRDEVERCVIVGMSEEAVDHENASPSSWEGDSEEGPRVL